MYYTIEGDLSSVTDFKKNYIYSSIMASIFQLLTQSFSPLCIVSFTIFDLFH